MPGFLSLLKYVYDRRYTGGFMIGVAWGGFAAHVIGLPAIVIAVTQPFGVSIAGGTVSGALAGWLALRWLTSYLQNHQES